MTLAMQQQMQNQHAAQMQGKQQSVSRSTRLCVFCFVFRRELGADFVFDFLFLDYPADGTSESEEEEQQS